MPRVLRGRGENPSVRVSPTLGERKADTCQRQDGRGIVLSEPIGADETNIALLLSQE